ncbi:hypothetical protein THH46_17100 [Pseudomonas sp. NA13]
MQQNQVRYWIALYKALGAAGMPISPWHAVEHWAETAREVETGQVRVGNRGVRDRGGVDLLSPGR